MAEKTVVALAVDKVQTFLTEVIHSHVQEKQTESETLSSIVKASQGISDGFHKAVKKKFATEKLDGFQELLACSGVYIFSCKMEAAAIKTKIDELFLDYYKQSQGQKLLKGVCFAAGGRKEIELIQEAKKRLKQTDYFNKIVERNKDKLFSFQPVKRKALEEAKGDNKDYPCFAETINELFYDTELKQDERYHGVKGDNSNRFQIAVIKADLDGMGKLFQGIQDYQTYQDVSKALNECISLDSLHTAAKKEKPQNKKDWLFPLYIAGDDIFFAVGVGHLFQGLDVCRRILNNVNQKLTQSNEGFNLTLSIGVEVTINRQPIRYYMEMVEDQLKNAKKAKAPEALKQFTNGKISIGGLTFFDLDYDAVKKRKEELKCNDCKWKNKKCPACREKQVLTRAMDSNPLWCFFVSDVKLLREIQRNKDYCEKLGTPSFFYTLLEGLTEPAVQNNTYKYINRVLYHLLPQYLESADRKLADYEMLLNMCIIKQLCKHDHYGNHIVLDDSTKNRLEGYLRLMLLCSDTRFHITENLKDKDDGKKSIDAERLKDAPKLLLNKPRKYLVDEVLRRQSKGLTAVFAEFKIYKNGNDTRECFKHLHIQKSMFFKLRNTEKVSVEKAADRIALFNPLPDGAKNDQEAEEIIKKRNEERQQENKSPCLMYFNSDKFIQYAPAAWTPDFVDSLMLLYTYHDALMRFKKLHSNSGEESKK